jgi:hypothetical protein
MSPLPRTAERPQVARPATDRRDAEAVLRDVAFVLEMTRRVKGEILAEQGDRQTREVVQAV